MRLIEFGPSAGLQADDLLGGLGLRDLWDVNARLQLDLGVRLDWGLRRESPTFSPRFGLRYRLDEAGRTTIKGSAGLFVGRAPLGALAFGQFPARMETTFDATTGRSHERRHALATVDAARAAARDRDRAGIGTPNPPRTRGAGRASANASAPRCRP